MESAFLLRIYKLFKINDFHVYFLKGFLSFYLYWDFKCFLFLKCMLFLYIKINYCHLSFEYIFHLRCIVFCDRNVETHLLLRDPSIVLNIPQKYHTLPADVLPSASEDLFAKCRVEHENLNQTTPQGVVWLSFWFSTRFTRKKRVHSRGIYLYNE